MKAYGNQFVVIRLRKVYAIFKAVTGEEGPRIGPIFRPMIGFIFKNNNILVVNINYTCTGIYI